MALPPTYYDFVRKLRATLVEKGEQNAAELLRGPNPPEAIHGVDDYDSRFPQYIERLNAEILGYEAEHPGVRVEEMSPFLSSAPLQAKASLASLYGTVNNKYHSVVNFAHRTHGPESQYRKLIWIRPYYKGPDLAVTINKPYLMK